MLQDAPCSEDVHEGGARGALRAVRGRARAASRLARPQGGARVQADPRSPERGQYGFLQDLVRASPTRRSRARSARRGTSRPRRTSRRAFGEAEQEIVEVVAAHYRGGVRGAARRRRRREIKASARELLARAGERARRSPRSARRGRTSSRRAELADDAARAGAPSRAGREMATRAMRSSTPPRSTSRESLELLGGRRRRHAAARVAGRLAQVETGTRATRRRRSSGSSVRSQPSPADEPDADVADLAARLARDPTPSPATHERAVEPVELALEVAQALRLPRRCPRALGTRRCSREPGVGRRRSSRSSDMPLVYALEHDLVGEAAHGVRQPLGCLLPARPLWRGVRGPPGGARARPPGRRPP